MNKKLTDIIKEIIVSLDSLEKRVSSLESEIKYVEKELDNK